jgi:hypothetical protein
VAPDLMEDLRAVQRDQARFEQALAPYLHETEIEQAIRRVHMFLERGVYPTLNPRRNVPYGWW